MPDSSHLYDKDGKLKSVQTLMGELREGHAGVAPIGLAKPLLDRRGKEEQTLKKVDREIENVLKRSGPESE